ncbi:MAG: MiaB/RimO family radical SAM methylthiotransferase [Candidatus Gracilibacteria bacterium]|jgi:threonylcarbamoyladenosine tRNA methylthiotransferase MtaB
MRIAIKTLGCKANRYESDRLAEVLNKNHKVFELHDDAGAFLTGSLPEVLIVNTCTVTQVADRKSRQVIYGLKRLYPECKIIVFGCGSNVDPEEYKKLEGVDYVAKNTEEILKIIEKLDRENFEKNCKNELDESPLQRTRALLKIQDGCNNYCTYCIVPRARGPEVSYPSKKILKEALAYEKDGYKEIVLTGINTDRWQEKVSFPTRSGILRNPRVASRWSLCRQGRCGNDKRGNDMLDISDLIKLLIKNTKTIRFRISSIEPKKFPKKFYELFKIGRLCPHVHMSLQSGSDSVLKRMHRNYSTAEFLKICREFKKAVPDVGLTTDVIVGFPGETEKEFDETCKFVQKIGFLKIHIFPYSRRKNTVAYYMSGQIPEGVKKTRAEKLRKIADEMSLKFKKSLLGKTYEILVENPRGKFYKGFTPNYIPVQFLYTGKKAIVREFVKVRLEKNQSDGSIYGKLEL